MKKLRKGTQRVLSVTHINAGREEAGGHGGLGLALFREEGAGYFLCGAQFSGTQNAVVTTGGQKPLKG